MKLYLHPVKIQGKLQYFPYHQPPIYLWDNMRQRLINTNGMNSYYNLHNTSVKSGHPCSFGPTSEKELSGPKQVYKSKVDRNIVQRNTRSITEVQVTQIFLGFVVFQNRFLLTVDEDPTSVSLRRDVNTFVVTRRPLIDEGS